MPSDWNAITLRNTLGEYIYCDKCAFIVSVVAKSIGGKNK